MSPNLKIYKKISGLSVPEFKNILGASHARELFDVNTAWWGIKIAREPMGNSNLGLQNFEGFTKFTEIRQT